MNDKGYVMTGLSFLLIIPAILLVAIFVEMTHMGGESSSLALRSDVSFYTAKDIERNIPIIGKEVLRETANDVVESGTALENSRTTIKNNLQARMNQVVQKYQSETGATNITCTIHSVESSTDPWYVKINSTIYVKRSNIVHNETISQDVSLEQLKDPLPFIKCKNYGGVTHTDTRILYGSSLLNLLNAKGMANATVYENATSPLFIKRCPYEPYTDHGNLITLKNCIDNGYFHESADGACFLCRLEGKAICTHPGLETFVTPPKTTNLSLSNIFAPCSIDHVLFSDTVYPGKGICYYSWKVGAKPPKTYYLNLYLDKGHRQKYGLPTY